MNPFAWMSARTVSEAAAAASTTMADAMTAAPGSPGLAGTAVVKAGGVDVLDLLKEGLVTPATLVNLRDVPGLDLIKQAENGGWRIGAMVTLARIAGSGELARRHAALVEAVRESASPQLRHVATLGGNLLQRPRCWYFRAAAYHCLRKGGGHCFAISGENQYHAIFDNHPCAIVHPSTAATALVALGAEVDLAAADGTVRRVKLEEFFVHPDRDVQRENDLKPHEILIAIRLPRLPAGARTAHVKQGEKDSFDWPLADVAVVLDLSADGACRSASVVLGAAAPVPHRARGAEQALVGRRIDADAAAAAGRAALDGATPLSRNAYKLPLFEALVRRAVLKAAGRT